MANSIPDSLKATVADMRCAYPECELVELTNLDDPAADTINDPKLQFALDQAFAFICAFDVKSCPAGKVAIRYRLKRAMLVIARYEIDVFHQRPDVKTEYDDILQFLKDCTDKELCNCTPSPEDLLAVGLTESAPVGFKGCFDERRWQVPEVSDALNLPYFDNMNPRNIDRGKDRLR